MGGYGSTRWGWHRKATTVEECLILDIRRLRQEGIVAPELMRRGGWAWYDGLTGRKSATIGFAVDTETDRGSLRLQYRLKALGEEIDYAIRLTTTRPYFGGVRWYFTCPLNADGRLCGRRVCKLYLPPTGRYFGCRHCYQLSYRSAQEADKRISFLRRNPEALLEALQSSDYSTLLLALKAVPDEIWRR